MKKFDILRLEDLYSHQCTSLAHDAIHNRAPKALKTLLFHNIPAQTISLRSQQSDPHHIRVPTTKTKIGKNSFFCQGLQAWNNLPKEIQEIKSKSAFKNRTKKLFIDQYHDRAHCNNPSCSDKKHHQLHRQ